MNILFVCSECSPFIKTGGLADVLGSLPQSLSNYVNCNVVLPYYKKIKENIDTTFICSKYIKFYDEEKYVGVYKYTQNNVNYYFIDNNEFFDLDNIYSGSADLRFTFFNIAVVSILELFNADVIHLHDWHAGLIPFLLKKNLINIKTIFTIHNIQYQGVFDIDLIKYINHFDETILFNNKINFMKCAIVNSDIITTVSNTYRKETLTYQYSYYLENILLSRQNDYYGILNGIDINVYNPLTDKYIYHNYDSIEGKLINKVSFCKEFDLSNDMLCSLVSRLCDQKGIELILNSLDEIITTTSINFFLMGTGDSFYEERLRYFSNKYPSRVKIFIGYDEKLAQKVYASSDLLLVPSKFEPCGLTQLIAMRYATLPLVRETGGLKDTVEPFNKYTNTGCGFSFKNFTTNDFKNVLLLAYDTYFNKDIWNILVENAMKKDFSFDYSSKLYLNLYKK